MQDITGTITEPVRFYFDLDGTLAHWRPVSSEEELLQKGFFARCEPSTRLIKAVRKLNDDPMCEVWILSAFIAESQYARDEKLQWCRKYLPFIGEGQILLTPCGTRKSLAVSRQICKTDILVDDFSRNLHEWCIDGGTAVKFKNGINGTNGTWNGYLLTWDASPDTLTKILREIAGKTKGGKTYV